MLSVNDSPGILSIKSTSMILEKAGAGDYADAIRSAKTFMDIAKVFQSEFGITNIPGQDPPETETDYLDENTPYGLRTKGIKAREKLNAAAKEILARVAKPEDLTAEDRTTLMQYSGRGGLTENSQFEYYTPAYVAEGVWDLMKSHGFENGNVMDPCTGAGVFSGTKPAGVVVTGCDIDPVGSKVAALLNPGDKITNQPFEEIVMATQDNAFDSFVGNVPFGSARGKSAHLDPEYSKEKRIERYFILRAIDKVKPGGLCCFVVPTGVVGNKASDWQKFRIAVSKKAEFLGAHKLPSKTFKAQGTDTVTDIIVLKKHPADLIGRIPDLPFDTLKQDLVVWDEFVTGMYWQGEGRPFIMGNYVPKVDGDRWSRETVDGDIDSAAIKAKLAQKFNSRINWDALEIAAPIIRNYIDGDRREINGLEYELVAGEWRKVNIIAEDATTMDADKFGAKNLGELKSILSDNKSTLALTASQMWAIRKAYPDMLSELQKQSIEFAMSQPNEAICEQLYRGSIIGGMIGRYREASLEGVSESSELAMLQDMVSAEIGKYGHPKNNKALNLTGESARMFGLFMNAMDEKGNFSDLLAGNMNAAGNTLQFDSTNPQSIIEHLFVREGILNIELSDVQRLYSGSKTLTLSDIADFDAIAITPDKMLMPLGRYCSGDIYPKMAAMSDAMLNEDDEKIKAKWQKQIDEINRKRTRTNPEDISFGLRQKWFSPEYIVNFLRENGYPKVEYGKLVDEEREDPVSGKILTTKKFTADYDNPFGEFTGIEGGGFPKQFLNYLNGGNVTSSGEDAQERITAYKNQCRVIEENLNVYMKQHLDIDQVGELYNMKFNSIIQEEYSGDDLGLKDVSPQVKLHNYQNAGVRRMSEEGRGCLSFDVGLGKSYSALGLCQYNMQMGRSKRTCIVVPDSVLANWYHSAKQFFGKMDDVLTVGFEIVPDKTGAAVQEPVIDETGNHKKNKHTGEYEYQDKLVKRNSKEDIFAKMWEIPTTSKRIVIMSKEKFAMIPMMPETKGAYVNKMVDKALISAANAAAAIKENSAGAKTGKSYADDVKQANLEQQFSDEGTKKKGELPYYEMMGFTDVIVDEAHAYKNSFKGGENTSQIAYLPTAPSTKRALDMNMKMNFIRDSNSGRGAYLLTATPVTNSPFEIYNMLALVCPPEEFERFGVYTIDDFVRVFGEIVPVDKMCVSGEIKSKDGLVGFQNLGGLRSIFHKYVNMKDAADVNLVLPPHDEINDEVELTDEQRELYEILREKAHDAMKPGKKAREDTMFAVIRDMDRATTDMDLYNRKMTFVFPLAARDPVDTLMTQVPKMMKIKSIDEETNEKIEYERELVFETKTESDKYILIVPEEYEQHVVTRLQENGIKAADVTHPLMPKYAKLIANMQKEIETGGKQLVFTEEKSQHEKIMRIMVHNLPMVQDKIGIINADAASGGALQGITDSYNSGKLAVVICNKKAEVGVNLQKGTTAIHHLTLPWTPASIQQRNGRGVRQGNTAAHINVYYYLGKGSFDVYRLDLLKKKASWMKELFNGKTESAENANADNADDMMDLLAANPEEAKQRRLEKLEAKKNADKEREDKRLINQLSILASASKALAAVDTDKQSEADTIQKKLTEFNFKISDFKRNAVDADEETRTKLGEKVLVAQQNADSLNVRLSGLDAKYEKKRQGLDARVKQISGVLRGTAKNGALPFSEALIDKSDQCQVSLSGKVVAIGDQYEIDHLGNKVLYVVTGFDETKKVNLRYLITDRPGPTTPIDTLMAKGVKVSYSKSEIDEMKLLQKTHSYRDIMEYSKEFFIKHREQIRFISYDAIPHELPDGSLIINSPSMAPEGANVLFPEPNDEAWRKRFCMFVLKSRGDVSYRLQQDVLGDGYQAIVDSYGHMATDTEILTVCASVYNEWASPLIESGLHATGMNIQFIRSNFSEKVRDALSHFDNSDTIRKVANGYRETKQEELRAAVAAEQAVEDQKNLEALKASPDYKEILPEIADAFGKIGITVRTNPGDISLRVSKYKSEAYKPYSRWFFQDKSGIGGKLYTAKEVLKARYGAKYFKDEGDFRGSWWHVPSSTDLKDIFNIVS